MQGKTAVLLGATGLIGNHLLQLLLEDDYFSGIRILVRNPLPITHPKLEMEITDFNDPDKYNKALGKGNTIFCCIGTTMKKVKGDKVVYRHIDFGIPVQAAQWGIDKGFTQYIVVSSVGANIKSSNFYLQLKGSMETALHALPYTALHIFRPSFLLGSREEKRKGERLVQAIIPALAFALRGSFKKYRAVKAEDVAMAMLRAAQSDKKGLHIHEYPEINKVIR